MNRKFLLNFFAFTLFISVFSSCDLFENGDDTPTTEDKYLVSYEMVRTYQANIIQLAFDQFSTTYPELEPVKDLVEYGVIVYKVSYKTTFKDEEKIASGLVCIPLGNEAFPVISYQNGTNTEHAKAPSQLPGIDVVNGTYEFINILELVASTGFVVTIPDYLGFGTSSDMFHPYLDKESTVQTVLDMQRAVKEMATNYLDTEIKNELYIAGYSQGGWATMQVQKAIEQNYSSEFNLKASACGGGPYDLSFINETIMAQATYPMPYFLGYIFNSYKNLEDITTPLTDVFQEPYAGKILTLYDGSKSGADINLELTSTVADLFTADYIANFKTDAKYASVRSSLEKNSIEAWNITTPTRLYHGTSDNFVTPLVTANIYTDFLTAGVSPSEILSFPLPGMDHQDAIIPMGLASIEWFIELKEAGETAP